MDSKLEECSVCGRMYDVTVNEDCPSCPRKEVVDIEAGASAAED
jgi:uncharacterized OB-fold protein